MFGELAAMNRTRDIAFLVVHLPAGRDGVTPEALLWQAQVPAMLAQLGIDYLDLDRELPSLTPLTRQRLESEVYGHFSVRGHAWAAGLIYAHLRRRPDVVGRLEAADSAR